MFLLFFFLTEFTDKVITTVHDPTLGVRAEQRAHVLLRSVCPHRRNYTVLWQYLRAFIIALLCALIQQIQKGVAMIFKHDHGINGFLSNPKDFVNERGEVSETPPRSSETPPRLSKTPPRSSETPPRLSKTPPRSSETPPRLSKTPPGLSKTHPRLFTNYRQNENYS